MDTNKRPDTANTNFGYKTVRTLSVQSAQGIGKTTHQIKVRFILGGKIKRSVISLNILCMV